MEYIHIINLKYLLSYESIKRILDIIFALIIFVFLLPLLILLFLVILLFDKSPVIFTQTRVRERGHYFRIYKFRAMTYSKNSRFEGLVNENLKETKENARKRFKTTEVNDYRISKIGRLIRPIHLDELPQLVNVIKGDMSFVGPRPDVPVQEIDYSKKDWEMRISVKPGITGLAQLYQCKKLSERNNLDKIYVKRKSFFLDIYILIRTMFKLFYSKSN